MEKETVLKRFMKLTKTTKAILLIAIMAIIATLIIIVTSGSGKVTIDVESSLKQVLEISRLSAAEYTYNSIAEVKDEKNDKIKYYVAYNGTVKAGFNFDEIDITTVDNITIVTIPKIEITLNKVDKLDFIFTKKKYETNDVYEEALKACKAHLLKEATSNEELIKTAEESAIETIKALTLPIEEQLSEGHSIEIVIEK